MADTLVVYYSKTGSNDFLAKKIANDLNADLAQIKPRFNNQIIQIPFSQVNFTLGIKDLDFDVSDYDKIVLVGPIWTGQLINPLRTFLNKYDKEINNLHFVTCCGSTDDNKDEKFGYELVFNRVREMIANKCKSCTALPIALVIPEANQGNEDYIMKTRLTQDNFTGEILTRYNEFLEII